MMERHYFLAVPSDERQRLFGGVMLHRDRRLGVDRVRRILKRSAAVIHAKLAVGRRIEHVAVVGENGWFDPHLVEDALDLAGVADGVAVETADEVDLLIRLPFGLG